MTHKDFHKEQDYTSKEVICKILAVHDENQKYKNHNSEQQ